MAPLSPTAKDIFNYRYHHGTNLGSTYVLERWLSGSMYPSSVSGDGELDAVKESLRLTGMQATRAKWEYHWSTAVTDNDFNWLVATAKCNMIRLPIGWFTLGPAWCHGTAFHGDPAKVYLNAWASVKTLVQRAHDHGIGVMIDFHALPGGANGETHSGTCSGRAELWGNQFNLDLALRCLTYVAREANSMPGIIGLQLCNEANYNPPGMYDWYDIVISAIGALNRDIPIYISDGWDFANAIEYTMARNQGNVARNPVIIDTHKYYCFTASDTAQSVGEIVARVPKELGELDGKDGNVFDRGAVSAFVGEYSCALAESSWSQGGERLSMMKQFGQTQGQRWQERVSGSAFWTLKMDWMDGGEWGFKQQTECGAISPPHYLEMTLQQVIDACASADAQRTMLNNAAYGSHVDYWNQTAPGQIFDYRPYSDGWTLGWNDSRAFFRARADGLVPGADGGDRIGLLDLWVEKRMLESEQAKVHANLGWEWEHGFRKGIVDLETAVGITSS